MVRFVRDATAELGARLAAWQGGNMRNAIPFKAEVVLALAKDKVVALKRNGRGTTTITRKRVQNN